MITSRVLPKLILLSLLPVLWAGCQHSFAKKPLVSNLDATLWTQTAAEHDALCRAVFSSAELSIDKNIGNTAYTAALEQEQDTQRSGKEPAVIFDLDETVLNNVPFEAESILRSNRQSPDFDADLWNKWVGLGVAEALPGSTKLLAALKAKGIRVIYVTNRGSNVDASEKERQRAATLANLKQLNFPIESSPYSILMPGDQPAGEPVWKSDKTSRRAWVARQFRIVGLFGDDLGDFVSVEGKNPAERRGLVEQQDSRWGTSWFVLPNPMYGSWLRSITQGIQGDADQRLQKKMRLLNGFYAP